MTQEEKNLWIKTFPAWPLSLLDRFSQQIPIQLAAIYGLENKYLSMYYNTCGAAREFSFTGNFDANNAFRKIILNPENEFYRIERTDSNRRHVGIWANVGPSNVPIQFERDLYDDITFVFDRRLYGNALTYYYTSYFKQVWRIGESGRETVSGFFNNSITSYSGVESLIILSENGISIDLDITRSREFLSYYLAYTKNEKEIATRKAQAAQANAVATRLYREGLLEKIESEKRSMAATGLQIKTQLQNEAASAKRDFLNTFLGIASLRQTLATQLKR